MARKSRKPQNLPKVEAIKTDYRVAAYVRLSVMDNGKNSDSIELQKSTVIDYIDNDPQMVLYSIYADNGATGTNFEREGFERMMEDVKSKKVNCIIVKELSRFGRNYIETGNYLEKIFPFLGIRFISIADNFDTFDADKSEDGYIIPLKNLIHDIYSKDISRKVGLSQKVMQEKGMFVGAIPPYGYNRSETDSHKLAIDEEVAPIVKRIFEMRVSGVSYSKIARILENENIFAPSKYRYTKGVLKHEKYKTTIWQPETIKAIIVNATYTGNMVQGKTITSIYKGQKKTKIPKEEFVIVPNTHEAIVSGELFEKAEQMRKENITAFKLGREKNIDIDSPVNLLQGLIYCGNCGRVLSKKRAIDRKKKTQRVYHYFYCRTNLHHKDKCTFKMIQNDFVTEVVLTAIKAHIHTIIDLKSTLLQLQKSRGYQQNKMKQENEHKKIKDRLAQIHKYKKALLESYLDKIISESDFLNMSSLYSKEIEQLNADEMQSKTIDVSTTSEKARWITAFENFSKSNEVTPELIKSLVKKIIISTNKEIEVVLKYQDEFIAFRDSIRECEVSIIEQA